MGRNEAGKEHVRSLTTMGAGRSLGLTIPIELVRGFSLAPHQKVRVLQSGSQIVIKLKKN